MRAHLGVGRPVGQRLEALPHGVVAQDVESAKFHARLAQRVYYARAEPAARRPGRALHNESDLGLSGHFKLQLNTVQ